MVPFAWHRADQVVTMSEIVAAVWADQSYGLASPLPVWASRGPCGANSKLQ